MTALVQTSSLVSGSDYGFIKRARRVANTQYHYQASVVDFDGEEYDFEVMAYSSKEAAAQVEGLAAGEGIQISYVNLYLVG